MAVREIAGRESLTPMYVEKILVTLRKSGLVKSLRGVNGGYALSRAPDLISVAAVLAALGQVDLGRDICKRFTGTARECVHAGDCGIRPVWGLLTQYIFGFLGKINLVQLTKGEVSMSGEVEKFKEQSPLPAQFGSSL
jgi:Rrf2 family protein